jgi:hypothetical protein
LGLRAAGLAGGEAGLSGGGCFMGRGPV